MYFHLWCPHSDHSHHPLYLYGYNRLITALPLLLSLLTLYHRVARAILLKYKFAPVTPLFKPPTAPIYFYVL